MRNQNVRITILALSCFLATTVARADCADLYFAKGKKENRLIGAGVGVAGIVAGAVGGPGLLIAAGVVALGGAGAGVAEDKWGPKIDALLKQDAGAVEKSYPLIAYPVARQQFQMEAALTLSDQITSHGDATTRELVGMLELATNFEFYGSEYHECRKAGRRVDSLTNHVLASIEDRISQPDAKFNPLEQKYVDCLKAIKPKGAPNQNGSPVFDYFEQGVQDFSRISSAGQVLSQERKRVHLAMAILTDVKGSLIKESKSASVDEIVNAISHENQKNSFCETKLLKKSEFEARVITAILGAQKGPAPKN